MYKFKPLVSIVIPTFNHANYLSNALQSVLHQTYTNWEAIVIDNHSTDDNFVYKNNISLQDTKIKKHRINYNTSKSNDL